MCQHFNAAKARAEEARYRDLASSPEQARINEWAAREVAYLSAKDHARRAAAVLCAISPAPSQHWLARLGRAISRAL